MRKVRVLSGVAALGLALALPASAVRASPGIAAVAGAYSTSGSFFVTSVKNGQTLAETVPIATELLELSPTKTAVWDGLYGSWKKKGNHFAANFSKSYQFFVKSSFNGAKASASFTMPKVTFAGDEVAASFKVKYQAKEPGLKLKVTASGQILGSKLP